MIAICFVRHLLGYWTGVQAPIHTFIVPILRCSLSLRVLCPCVFVFVCASVACLCFVLFSFCVPVSSHHICMCVAYCIFGV